MVVSGFPGHAGYFLPAIPPTSGTLRGAVAWTPSNETTRKGSRWMPMAYEMIRALDTAKIPRRGTVPEEGGVPDRETGGMSLDTERGEGNHPSTLGKQINRDPGSSGERTREMAGPWRRRFGGDVLGSG